MDMHLDSEVFLQAHELAEMINQSVEVMEFLSYKQVLDKNQEVMQLKKRLARENEKYEEVNRFSHYHPDYKKTKENLDKILLEIDQHEMVKAYKKAEEKVDDLLYEVTRTLALAISNTIKVGKNELNHDSVCSTGGCSTCGLKGSCAI